MVARRRLRTDLVSDAEVRLAKARAQKAEDDVRVLMNMIALSRWNTGSLGLRGARLVAADRPRTRDWVAEVRTAVRIPRQRNPADAERTQPTHPPRTGRTR